NRGQQMESGSRAVASENRGSSGWAAAKRRPVIHQCNSPLKNGLTSCNAGGHLSDGRKFQTERAVYGFDQHLCPLKCSFRLLSDKIAAGFGQNVIQAFEVSKKPSLGLQKGRPIVTHENHSTQTQMIH